MYPKWLVFLIWGAFEGRLHPKCAFMKILGVFKEANVSQMARILDLGCIFASDCIPNVLF